MIETHRGSMRCRANTSMIAFSVIFMSLSCTSRRVVTVPRLALPPVPLRADNDAGNNPAIIPANDLREKTAAPNSQALLAESDDSVNPDSWQEAAEFFRRKRWPIGGDLPAERYIEARRQIQRLPLYSIAEGRVRQRASDSAATPLLAQPSFGTWQPLGPGNIGGRVRGLVVHPKDPNTIYAGSATGGVWKTTDGGQSWFPLTDFLPVLSVSSLVMSPTDPNTLFVGTGEASRGAGIFKSTDGGQTWVQLPQTATADFYYVYKLAFSTARPTNLFAATGSGVWMSLNGGNTWKQAYASPAGQSVSCSSLAIRSDQPKDIVFANCSAYNYSTQQSTNAVYRNLDPVGNAPWVNVLTDPAMGPVALAISASSPNVVYALASDSEQTSPFRSALLGVYRSDAGGDSGTWQLRTSNADPDPVNPNILSYPNCPYTSNDHHGQGGYNLDIAVDPTNPDRVFAAGIVLFRSDDGGANWGYINAVSGKQAHYDQHILAFRPNYNGQDNQTLFVGNDGGVFRTDNALALPATGANAFCYPSPSEVAWTNLNNSFATTQFYHGTVYPGGTAYFGGSQDNGTSRGTDSGGPNQWSYLYGGDGGAVAVDPIDANTLFYEYINLSILKTINGGQTTFSVTNGITEPSIDFQFINWFTMDPFDSSRLYTGGYALWRTLDSAANWSQAGAALPKGNSGYQQTITTVTVSPEDPNVAYFGTTDGRVYRSSAALSSDATTQWSYSRPAGGYVSRIVVDAKQPLTVYAVYASFRYSDQPGQIFRSVDGGVNWSVLNGSSGAPFPDIPSHVLLIDPNDSSRLYVGTDIGVFVSLDAGVTWMHDANPFADAITESLLLDQNGGTTWLYAFTYGRGVWRVSLPGQSLTNCTYSVSPSTIDVPALGGAFTVDIQTGSDCKWVAITGSANPGIVSIQSPARGQGSGTVYVVAHYNPSAQPRVDRFYVQDQAVIVTQSVDGSGIHNLFNDHLSSAKQITPLPYNDDIYNGSFTQDPSDPKHSCTGAQDFRSAWWIITVPLTGRLLVTATDAAGGTGIVLSAYRFDRASGIGGELACSTFAPASTWGVSTSVQLDVVAGSSYAIEVSAPVAQVPPGGWISVGVSFLPDVTISPSAVSVVRGSQQQFTATVTGMSNAGVRWTISPPVGTISPNGLYSAPANINTPTNVAVIAQSLPFPAARTANMITVTPSIVPNPSTVNLSWQQGAPPPQPVAIALTPATGRPSSFTTSASASWLAVKSTGSIPGTITVTADPTGLYPGTYAAQVIVNVPSVADTPLAIPVSLTIIENSTGPSSVSVSPASGTSSAQTYTGVFSDPLSYTNIQFAEINITTAAASTAACDVRYDAQSKAFLLRMDNGTSWSTPVTPGMSGTASNGQCTVHGLASNAVGAGKNLSVTVAVSFTLGFAGNKSIYLFAQNASGSSGWQLSGSWTVNTAPSIVGVAPNGGSGPGQTFTFIYNDPTGAWDSHSWVGGSFNPASSSPTDKHACSFWSYGPFGGLGMWDDTETNAIFMTFGQAQVVQNSQCTIRGTGSSGTSSGNIVTLVLNVSFGAPSNTNLYIYASEADTHSGNYYQMSGIWTVEAQSGLTPTISASPSVVTFTVASGASPSVQKVSITTTPPGFALTTATEVTIPAGDQWLTASLAGTTLSLLANPAGLQAGTYQGTVTLSVNEFGALAIPVTLIVTNATSNVPMISSVQDAESAQTVVAPGQWVAIYGSNLSTTTRQWTNGDLKNGTILPTVLDGVTVQFGNQVAPVYFVSPAQLDVQVPSGLLGSVPVTVTYNGMTSAPFSVMILQNAPSLFAYPAGGILYPAAIHSDGTLIGDPAVQPGTTKAHAGETIVLFVNGLAASESGVVVPSVISYTRPVNVKVGGEDAFVAFAGLVAAGQYQVNIVVPNDLTSGNYPVTVSAGGQVSSANVVLPIG